MDEMEKKRLANVLKSLNIGTIEGLPKYIIESMSDGLVTLAEELLKTRFLYETVYKH